jgi:hypothetical protein
LPIEKKTETVVTKATQIEVKEDIRQVEQVKPSADIQNTQNNQNNQVFKEEEIKNRQIIEMVRNTEAKVKDRVVGRFNVGDQLYSYGVNGDWHKVYITGFGPAYIWNKHVKLVENR